MACSTCKTVQWNKHSSAPYAMFEQNLTFQDNKHDSAPYPMFEQTIPTLTNDEIFYALQNYGLQIQKNSSNLLKVGSDLTKIGQDNIYFGDSITRIDNVLSSLQNQINVAKEERDELQSKYSIHANNPNAHHVPSSGGGGGISLPLIGGIGTTGLIVGGLALYLLTRKK